MKIFILCKRRYTNKDLIEDRFGRLYEIPKRWVAAGHNVTILAVSYRWHQNDVYVSDGISMKSLSMLPNPLNFIKKTIENFQHSRPDIVIASGDSHLGFIAAKLAENQRIPFVFDLYHYYPDFKSNSIPGMKKMFNHALNKASAIVCDSQPLANKVNHKNQRCEVVEQGVSLSDFYPNEEISSKRALKLPESQTYLGYTGSLDSRFDQDVFFKVMETLYREDGIALLIAGKNTHNINLNKKWITYLGNLPQRKIPTVISACKLMIIPYNNSALSKTCNPCKLTEYIACRRPLLSTKYSNIEEYLSENSLITERTEKEYINSIRRQLKTPHLERITRRITWDQKAHQYLDILKDIHTKPLTTR